MRRLHHHAMAGGLLMAGDQLSLMEELIMLGAFLHANEHAHILGRYRVTRRADRHQGVVGHPPYPHPFVAIWRRPPNGVSCSRAKRSTGRSWVVPWSRTSAISTLQRSSQPLSSCHELKRRPARALRLTYLTPLSTLPLVRAR